MKKFRDKYRNVDVCVAFGMIFNLVEGKKKNGRRNFLHL